MNRLPENATLIVDESKIVRYLLDPAHVDGAPKARFFKQLGYSAADWPAFALAIRLHATSHPIAAKERSPYGTKIVIDCRIGAVRGQPRCIRAVWIRETGSEFRLVTAYPNKSP